MTRTLWLDAHCYVGRIVEGDPGDRPKYDAAGCVFRFHDVAIVTGLVGNVSREDVRRFYTKLRADGVRYILGERQKGRFPGSREIDSGPFRGWQYVDLEDGKNV